MIQIGSYRISHPDEHNWVLEKSYISKSEANKGKECWKNIGYFGNIQLILKHLFEKMNGETEATTIYELTMHIKKCNDLIIDAIKSAKKQNLE